MENKKRRREKENGGGRELGESSPVRGKLGACREYRRMNKGFTALRVGADADCSEKSSRGDGAVNYSGEGMRG